MADIDYDLLTTIYVQTPGTWMSVTCGAFPQVWDGVIVAGTPCTTSSQRIDSNGNCFECVGFTTTEVRKHVEGSTVVYVKVAITFDEQGGSSVSDKDVYYNRTFGTLPTPTKSGHTFNGWFTASSGGAQITSGTTVTLTDTTLTLYAQWTAPATNWVYVGTSGAYDDSISLGLILDKFGTPVTTCSTSTTIDTKLTASYPPSGYIVGHRVSVAHSARVGGITTVCQAYIYVAQ